jgi:endonuclease/exonuclease/phosphatase family metal-dependent hydrolase
VSAEVLRVVQLNAGTLLEPDWPLRRLEVVAWLNELAPDVVCLQEIWQDEHHENTAGWIADHASTEWVWTFGGFALPSELSANRSLRFGAAILSRWPIDHAEAVALPLNDDAHDHALSGVAFPLLYVRTADIDVYTTHLQPPPQQANHRVRQVLFIDEFVRRTHDSSSHVRPILCGDFNAEPISDEIRFLTANAVIDGRSTYYQDAWAVTHNRGGITQDPNNELSRRRHLPPKRIDYVFVGDPFGRGGAGRIAGAKLAFNEPRTGTFASDHYRPHCRRRLAGASIDA